MLPPPRLQLHHQGNRGVFSLGMRELVIDQFNDLSSRYPSLLLSWDEQIGIIEGDLHFIATFNSVDIEDVYSIKIIVPPNYPYVIPKTFETSRRIPDGFHKFDDGSLCLEAPTKQYIEFSTQPTLLFYVEKLVIEYLYGYSHFQRFGTLPYGERAHGNKGILSFYRELFEVDDYSAIMRLLYVLCVNQYRGHLLCPCGSGNKARYCHGNTIRNLVSLGLSDRFQRDYMSLHKENHQRRATPCL